MNSADMETKCRLCGTQGVLFSKVNGKRYYNCSVCKSIFMDPKDYVSTQEEKERYKEHNNDIYDLRYQEFVSPIVNAVQSDYKTDTAGLDFGCGTGPVISKLLMDKGYELKLYDPFFAYNPENLQITYDYIVCCEVVEHFHNPMKEFSRLRSLLKPGGTIFIKTKIYSDDINFENWRYKNDPTHVFFYRRETLEWIHDHFTFSGVSIEDTFIKFIL